MKRYIIFFSLIFILVSCQTLGNFYSLHKFEKCVKANDIYCVENILDQNTVNVDEPLDEYNALQISAQRNLFQMAELLLKKGADVNNVAKDGSVPLQFASMIGSYELVQLFLKNGADVNLTSSSGINLLDICSITLLTTLISNDFENENWSKIPWAKERRPNSLLNDYLKIVNLFLSYNLSFSDTGKIRILEFKEKLKDKKYEKITIEFTDYLVNKKLL